MNVMGKIGGCRLLPLTLCSLSLMGCVKAPGQMVVEMTADTVEVESGRVTMLCIGDMMQHDAQITAAYNAVTKQYDYSSYFAHFDSISKAADIAVCNFEVTLGGKPYKGYPCFSAPDEYLGAIVDAGYDVFLTANNHCLDKGRTGVVRTIDHLRDAGITQLGTYKDSLDRVKNYPVLLICNGVRIALLNFTYGTNGLTPSEGSIVNYIDKDEIMRDIEKAQLMSPDFILAFPHWGIEYKTQPNQEQKNLARWLIENGVDHVIGGHPHVVQPAEIITTGDGRRHLVEYSLGNVISNMKIRHTVGGIFMGLTLDKEDYNKTADSAWWSSFKVARPAETRLKNFTAYPVGFDASEMPEGEAARAEKYFKDAREVMETGAKLKEKSCKEWGF